MKFYGSQRQDEFVYHLFERYSNYRSAKHGFFIDIGCGNPIDGSNTYALEQLGWKGLAFDVIGCYEEWEEKRPNTTFMRVDTTTTEFACGLSLLLQRASVLLVDYISLDVEVEHQHQGHINYNWKSLVRLITSGVRFKCMTLAHEYYLQGQSTRLPTRMLLDSLGYRRLFSDVLLPTVKIQSFEDWWIEPKYFIDDVMKSSSCNINCNECISKLIGV